MTQQNTPLGTNWITPKPKIGLTLINLRKGLTGRISTAQKKQLTPKLQLHDTCHAIEKSDDCSKIKNTAVHVLRTCI